MSDAGSLTFVEVMQSCEPLLAAGASLHWLVPYQKMPIEDEWTNAPLYSAADLEKSHRNNANIGIRLGLPSKIGASYLHLIDLDVRRDDLAEEAWSTLLSLWPEAKSFPMVVSGSGGASRHIYFLTKTPFRKKKLAKSAGFAMVFDERKKREVKKHDWEIDILGTGSQAVLPPSIHPDTKKPYRWLREIDFDLPMLLTIKDSLVESWGVGESTVSEDLDEDDLEALVAADPIKLEDGDLERILGDLPEDWVDDRDQWWTVGMALHHQFRGTNEGFEIWCEWARQSEKFDAKDSAVVWKSFKGTKNPIRLPTLIQAANVTRMQREMDLEDDSTDHFVKKSSTDLADLLGPGPVPANAEPKVDYDPDWEQLLHRTEEGDVKATLPNMVQIVGNDPRTRGVAQFNEFAQQIVFRKKPTQRRKKHDKGRAVVNLDGSYWNVKDSLNGDNWTDTHDNSIRNFIEAPRTQGGYAVKVSDRDLRAAIDMCAKRNAFHPVREKIVSASWDGVPRVEMLFVDYLGCDDTIYHRQAAILTLMGLVTRIFEPGHKFDFVPILEGAQGKRKSTFIQTLGMEWSGELTGDISDSADMIQLMAGRTILEIGELSAMARHEVNDLKAFVSRASDIGRLPYDKRITVFMRQCIFIGSTNDNEYLRDLTGNRRYWPIVCKLEGDIDTDKLRHEVLQIYAEAYQMYLALRAKQPFGDLPLYMEDEGAQAEAVAMQNSRRVETSEEALAGKISAWLDNPIGSDDGFEDLGTPAILRNETCMAQIWEECLGRNGSIPTTEATKIGKALQLVGWTRTVSHVRSFEVNKKYGKCRVYTRP